MKRTEPTSDAAPPSPKRRRQFSDAGVALPPCATYDNLHAHIEIRAMVFGTSNYLICLGLACNLTLNTIYLALNLLHRALAIFGFPHISRHALCAASLTLSWKHLEDLEGSKHPTKIRDIVRGMFALTQTPTLPLSLPTTNSLIASPATASPTITATASPTITATASPTITAIASPTITATASPTITATASPTTASPTIALTNLTAAERAHEAALAAVMWACRDGGAELGRLREQVKLYEVLLLRAFDFVLAYDDMKAFPAQVAFSIHQLLPHIGEGAVGVFDTLQNAALGVVLDFYRWPLAMRYTTKLICQAAVFKAAVALMIPFTRADQEDLTEAQLKAFQDPLISGALQDIRTTYQWTTELSRLSRM